MRKLLLFAGLPGVGKSTISRQVGEKLGAHIVDIDDFKKTNVDPTLVSRQIDPPEIRWGYYQKALNFVFQLFFEQGVPAVILDEVFHLNSLRNQLEGLCRENEVQALWIEIQCPSSVVEKRLRATKREGHILSTEEALKMHHQFREIFETFSNGHQNHIIVNNESDPCISSLVEEICERG